MPPKDKINRLNAIVFKDSYFNLTYRELTQNKMKATIYS